MGRFNSADFGVPQTRFRVFLVALRRGVTNPLKWPFQIQGNAPTVGESIGDLMGARGWHGVTEWKKLAASPAPTIVGGSKKHGGPDLGPTRARREWAALGVDGLGLANEAPAENFEGMPRLTVPMVARLQSFPDDWYFLDRKRTLTGKLEMRYPLNLRLTSVRLFTNASHRIERENPPIFSRQYRPGLSNRASFTRHRERRVSTHGGRESCGMRKAGRFLPIMTGPVSNRDNIF